MKHISFYLPRQIKSFTPSAAPQVWHSDATPINLFIDQPEKFIQQMPLYHRRLLDYFLMMSNRFMVICPSHPYLAAKIGVGTTTIKKIIGDLIAWGLLAKNNLPYDTCRYHVSSWFKNLKNRMRLYHLIVAFKWNLLTTLIPFRKCIYGLSPKTCQCEYCLLYIKDNKSYLLNSLFRIVRGSKVYAPPGEAMGIDPISDPIKAIKSLNLTKWGQIRLMAYPDAAIKWAEQKMQYANMKLVRDPFKLFASHCVDYCRSESIQPNWEIVNQLELAFKAPQNRAFLLQKRSVAPSSSSPSFKSKVHQPTSLPQRESYSESSTKNVSEEIDSLKKQIAHYDEMIANPEKYFKPTPLFGTKIQEWVAFTKNFRAMRVQHLLEKECVTDSHGLNAEPVTNPHELIVSPLEKQEGDYGSQDFTFDEIHSQSRAGTVETSGHKPHEEDILRRSEATQADIWARTFKAAWKQPPS